MPGLKKSLLRPRAENSSCGTVFSMVALEHLHADALLWVLTGAALAMFSLRATVYFCHRALVARDRSFIASSGRAGRSHT